MVRSSVGVSTLRRSCLRTGSFRIGATTSNVGNLSLTLGRSFSLILLSVVLPKVSKLGIYAGLERGGSVPVVVMDTGHSSVSGVGKLNFNTSSCVIGPFSPNRLITEIVTRVGECRELASGSRSINSGYRAVRVDNLGLSNGTEHTFISSARLTLAGGRFSLLCFLTTDPSAICDGRGLFSRV